MDKYSSEIRKKMMSSVRSSKTRLEQAFAKSLEEAGLCLEEQAKDLFGKPDWADRELQIAVFVDSCYWHGCEDHCRMPASNREYWLGKIEGNKRRDQKVTKTLEEQGWRVIRIWEHTLKSPELTAVELSGITRSIEEQRALLDDWIEEKRQQGRTL